MTRANLSIVLNELTAFRARHARLQAERDGRAEPDFPADLSQRARTEPDIHQIIAGERTLFLTRATTKQGQKQQLGERVKQLREEITGFKEQMGSFVKQLVVASDELKDLGDLHGQGLAQRPRITSLQREILRNEGTVGDIKSKIAQSMGKIAETELQVLQLDRELANEVAREIRRGRDQGRRVAGAQDRRRGPAQALDIRAPISGFVHQLNAHTVGGVISPSEPIMLVVPVSDSLIVEARVGPTDIDQIPARTGHAHPLFGIQPAHHPGSDGQAVSHSRRPHPRSAIGAELLRSGHQGQRGRVVQLRQVSSWCRACLPRSTSRQESARSQATSCGPCSIRCSGRCAKTNTARTTRRGSTSSPRRLYALPVPGSGPVEGRCASAVLRSARRQYAQIAADIRAATRPV